MTKEEKIILVALAKQLGIEIPAETPKKDTFDREKYLSIAKELDALCQNGRPLKAVRPVIYKIMAGERTMEYGKMFVEDIKAGFKK